MCRNAVGSDRSPLANGIDTGVFLLLGALVLVATTIAFLSLKRSRSDAERHAKSCQASGRVRWENER